MPGSTRILALLILTIVVWGYNWTPLKIAALAIDPYWLSAWRVGAGALALFAVLGVLRRPAGPPPGRAYVGIGIAQVAGLVIFSTLALRFASVATVTALVFTMPIWTALFAYLILGERLSRARVLWLLVASAGIVFVGAGIHGGREVVGASCATVGGASWALGNVLQRRAGYTIDPVRLIAWQQVAAAIPLLVLALAVGHPVARLDPGVVASALFAALIGSGLAWLWWGMALRALPANTVALASFAIPVIGALGAWLQLGTPPAAQTAIGLGIVVIGLAGSVLSVSARRRETLPEAA